MSPFKVIRCRYYTEDGKAVPPYCSAGRHCTFLHPNDKGWPGGGPFHEIEKRSEERDRAFRDHRSRPRSTQNGSGENYASFSHERQLSRPSPMLDFSSSDNMPSRKNSSQLSKDISSPVHSIVQLFHEIAGSQIKLTQDREALEKATDKVSSFRELSRSLSKVSTTSTAVVAPILEAVINARQEVQRKVDADTKQMTDLWDSVFSVFLRAICRQFDNERESGTEFLRQEARVLLKSCQKTTLSPGYRYSEGSVPARYSTTAQLKSHCVESQQPDRSDTIVSLGGSLKERLSNENGTEAAKTGVINPPVGISDKGWGRKRRRFSSTSLEHDRQRLDDSPPNGIRDEIMELQEQLRKQNEKISLLAKQNEELETVVKRYSSVTPTGVHMANSHPNSDNLLPSPMLSDDHLSQIRTYLHQEVLALISPALEKQKQVNESCEARLSSIYNKLREMESTCGGEDVAISPPAHG